MANLSVSTARLPISVIIAMYNTGKYVGECLESLLAQTFKEFEVIVIDDCSTDNGNAVVKSYEKKFNGRLKLVRLKKNSGNNGIPNNMGLALSRGEYVLFMDSDDTITADALEKLYKVAKDFDADVVTCEKFYNVPQEFWNNSAFMKELKPYSYKRGDFITEPTLITEDIAERVKDCAQRKFIWNIWSKLIRRDFLVNNEITITNEMANDMMLTLFLIYSVKRFVVVPYTINFYRVLSTSLTHQKRDPLKQLKKYLRALTVGIRHLNNYLSKREFFQENAECKYTALNTYAQEIYNGYIQKVYDKVPARDREEALVQEFSVDDNTALMAFLFESLAKLLSRHRNILKLAPYITARVDIQLIPKKKQGDFQIVSVSDEKADVRKPAWLQTGGIGYQIQSYAGKMKIVTKTTAEGQIRFDFKGLDVRDAKDDTKRIPYRIDYTKLTVNGKRISDKTISAWHDEPYSYTLNVKAGEEVKLQMEWLPHLSDISAPAPPQENVKPIVAKPLPQRIARIDFKLESTDGGDFQILSVSDDKADVKKATWLKGNNFGYFILSDAGKLEIVAKVVKGGLFVMGLRGRDVRDPADNSKRIPEWVDYTKLTLNGKVIFDKPTPAWHDKAYSYMTNIEADDEITIQIEWINTSYTPALAPEVEPLRSTLPISVIIPVYNASEYIGECLDSLLIQTFKDFEVIVVDDCSEDNSVEIINEYAPKFNGRLKLSKTEKNSGGGGYIPRNLGLTLASGKYIFFLDADDFILNTALETFYTAAEEHNTDVVYSSAHYDMRRPNDVSVFRDGLGREMLEHGIADKPTLIVDNPSKILYEHSFKIGFTFPWVKFIRRDFLIKNRIFFPEITKAGDHIWTINVYCHAKRILRLPLPLYFYRNYTSSSVSRTTRELPEQISYWVSAFIEWLEALGELINKTEVLKKNLACCYEISRLDFKFLVTRLTDELDSASTQEVYEVLYNELSRRNDLSHLNIIPFFFSAVDERQKEIRELEKKYSHATFNKFSARLDIQLKPTKGKGDFQIVSISDDKAEVRTPAWLQKGGIGYQIHSYDGGIKIVAKATVDGQVKLELKGLDIRDPKDDTKRLPCWIDYTFLTVNGKKIFNNLTPAWHDKPYRYTFDVKADDEIELQTKWLPHGSNVPALATTQEKVTSIAEKFLPYLTARLDVRLSTNEGGDFQIVSVSDDNANVIKAAWLTGNNFGYFIQSCAGKLELVTKVIGGGRFNLGLRGMNVPDSNDSSKRIPYWIDYTKLIVNGNTIFDTPTPAWHDKAYYYNLDVQDDEEIVIQAEWLPHKGDTPPAAKTVAPIQDQGNDAAILAKFKRWLSARLELKMITNNKNDFQIISISDDRADVNKPGWYNKNGVGYVIQSYAGKLDIVLKNIEGGAIGINLKGLFYADPKNKSKRIPYWIDYTKFKVNNNVVFNTLTPVWHDKPYNYTMEAKAGEDINISVEWLPHRSDT